MDNNKRQQALYLLNEYNRKLGEVYDALLDDVTTESQLATPEFQTYLQNSVINSLQPWFATELEGLADDTPEAFFDSLLAFDDVMDVFMLAAEKIDGDLPDHLMLRVGAFGEDSSKKLMELALAHDWTSPDGGSNADFSFSALGKTESADQCIQAFRDTLSVDLAALRVLGQWNYEPAIKPVLDRFCALAQPDELIADGVRAFISPFGEKIVPELIARLTTPLDPDLGGVYEYLLIFLTDMGRQEPEEDIFQCLKSVFRRMKQKVIASICLGDYGDGRAVPLLKSYLDRHIDSIDRQFFYETLSAIKRLGGDVSDVVDPFNDFSTKG